MNDILGIITASATASALSPMPDVLMHPLLKPFRYPHPQPRSPKVIEESMQAEVEADALTVINSDDNKNKGTHILDVPTPTYTSTHTHTHTCRHTTRRTGAKCRKWSSKCGTKNGRVPARPPTKRS